MPLQKQQFYEGAALHVLARAGGISGIRYESPFFVLNDDLFVLLKLSTMVRSPWGFTFSRDEQKKLHDRASRKKVIVGLICASDGVAALPYEAFAVVASERMSAVRISCSRSFHEHYEISGPDATLTRKVAPSAWQRILTTEVDAK